MRSTSLGVGSAFSAPSDDAGSESRAQSPLSLTTIDGTSEPDLAVADDLCTEPGGTEGAHAADKPYLRVLQSLNTLRESNTPKKPAGTAETFRKFSVLHQVSPSTLGDQAADSLAAIRLIKQYQLEQAVSEAAARPGQACLPSLVERTMPSARMQDFSLVSALRNGTPPRDVIKQSVEALEPRTYLPGKRAPEEGHYGGSPLMESAPVSPHVAPLTLPPAKRAKLTDHPSRAVSPAISPVQLTPSVIGAHSGARGSPSLMAPDAMLLLSVAATVVLGQ